jgi:hypothetical protein
MAGTSEQLFRSKDWRRSGKRYRLLESYDGLVLLENIETGRVHELTERIFSRDYITA